MVQSPRAASPGKGHGWRLAAAAASAQQAQIRKTSAATAPSFTTLREANAYLNGQVTLLKTRLAECLSREETETVKARCEMAEERVRSIAVELETAEGRGQSEVTRGAALQQEVTSLREELARAAERDRIRLVLTLTLTLTLALTLTLTLTQTRNPDHKP